MADQLPEGYWESLGEQGVFLRALLATQAQQLQHLQIQNQHLQNQFENAQSNLANAASAATLAAAQQMVIHTPTTTQHSPHPIKAADTEKFCGDGADTEGFIHAVKLSITLQPTSFPDEKTKMLYALSFISGGSAALWAHNNTKAIFVGT